MLVLIPIPFRGSKVVIFFNVRHPLLLYTIYIYIYYRVLLVLVLGCVIPFKFGSTILIFFIFIIIIRSAPIPYGSYFLICTILVVKKFESSGSLRP